MNTMTYPQGCLSAAWQDVKSSPGWFGRLFVLGLIMCVPVLNFVVAGYLLMWAREVPFGGRTALPQKMVTGKNFEMGFYALVLALAASFALGIVSGILGLIPFLGALISLACMLVLAVAVPLMQMRMIMAQSLGAGFDLADLWRTAQGNWGQLLVVTLVPSLVAGAAVSVVGVILVFFFMLVGMGGAMPMLMSLSDASMYSSADALMLVGTLLSVGFVGFVIVYVLACLVSVFADALTIRGLGHWVARYAPQWTALPYAQAASAYGAQPQQPMYQQPVQPQQGYAPQPQDPAGYQQPAAAPQSPAYQQPAQPVPPQQGYAAQPQDTAGYPPQPPVPPTQ